MASSIGIEVPRAKQSSEHIMTCYRRRLFIIIVIIYSRAERRTLLCWRQKKREDNHLQAARLYFHRRCAREFICHHRLLRVRVINGYHFVARGATAHRQRPLQETIEWRYRIARYIDIFEAHI